MTSKTTAFLLVLAFSVGCLGGADTEDSKINASKALYYIVSSVPYNPGLCGSTGYRQQEGGLNTGFMLILKDADSGDTLAGSIHITTPTGGGILTALSYHCEEQVNPRQAVLSIYSKGHTPAIMPLPAAGDMMLTVEVPMVKSCTGRPGCFDETPDSLLSNMSGNETAAEEHRMQARDRFMETVQSEFGLDSADYRLECAECDLDRGGFIKARGLYKNQTPFELYYRAGWCSPGGGDCGWELCLKTTSDALIAMAQEKACSRLYSYNATWLYKETEYQRTVVWDTTDETRQQCLNGGYTQATPGGQKCFSVAQNANQGLNYAARGKAECLEN